MQAYAETAKLGISSPGADWVRQCTCKKTALTNRSKTVRAAMGGKAVTADDVMSDSLPILLFFVVELSVVHHCLLVPVLKFPKLLLHTSHKLCVTNTVFLSPVSDSKARTCTKTTHNMIICRHY